MFERVVIRRDDANECRVMRVMRGAECSTDHLMQRTILSMKMRPHTLERGITSSKLNTSVLNHWAHA